MWPAGVLGDFGARLASWRPRRLKARASEGSNAHCWVRLQHGGRNIISYDADQTAVEPGARLVMPLVRQRCLLGTSILGTAHIGGISAMARRAVHLFGPRMRQRRRGLFEAHFGAGRRRGLEERVRLQRSQTIMT